MGKRTMPHIMQQYGYFCTKLLFFCDFNAFACQGFQCDAHEMISTEGVKQTGMYGSRINKIRKAHLLYTAQSLIKRMAHQFQYQRMVDGNKSINGIIDNFLRTVSHNEFVKRV